MEKAEQPAAGRQLRVVIADDHAVVRRGLREVIDASEGLELVAEASDLAGARRYVRGHHPDVLVLDLNLPEGTSLPAIPELRAEFPETQIVVLTMQNEPAYARRALGAGALGYVLKESAETELVEAIRRAAAGEAYLNPRLGARVAAEPASGIPDGLTEREAEILRMIALGHTNAEIAAQLFLSIRTVETHRAHIQQKLGLATRAELVRYALQHRLLDPASWATEGPGGAACAPAHAAATAAATLRQRSAPSRSSTAACGITSRLQRARRAR